MKETSIDALLAEVVASIPHLAPEERGKIREVIIKAKYETRLVRAVQGVRKEESKTA